MHITHFARFARCALVAIGMGLPAGDASAGAFTLSCAARDMQALMMIERRTSSFSQYDMLGALNTMMLARMTCHEGRVRDALAIYDSIERGVVADLPDFAQRP